MTKRKQYSKEFKLDAIALVIEQNYSQAEAARNLGISSKILSCWIKEADDDDGHAYHYTYIKKVQVNIDYHVEVEKHYYSVPHILIKKQLEPR